MNQGELMITYVFYVGDDTIRYTVQDCNGKCEEVSKYFIIDSVRKGYKFVNATVTKDGVIRVSKDVPREKHVWHDGTKTIRYHGYDGEQMILYKKRPLQEFPNAVAGNYFKVYDINQDNCTDSWFKKDVEKILARYNITEYYTPTVCTIPTYYSSKDNKFGFLYIDDNCDNHINEPQSARLFVFSNNIKCFTKAYLKSIEFLSECVDEYSIPFFSTKILFVKLHPTGHCLSRYSSYDFKRNNRFDDAILAESISLPTLELVNAMKKFFAAYDDAREKWKNNPDNY